MASESVPTRISILEKEYSVLCPPEERGALQESARYLSTKMEEAKSGGRALNQDRITVMTALNITFDYLKLREEKQALETALAESIHRISAKLASSSARRAPAAPVD